MTYRKLKLTRKNTYKKKVPNKPGIYRMHDKNHKTIYVGHASRLRHRIQSYVQEDCPKEHPTKPKLRKRAHSFSFRTMPKEKAKKLEKIYKRRYKYNHL